ncbi:hypothetical protein J2S78_002337 [Salibacterium salarium]|uniref:amidase domain-containing protein n=1 Tax=Salibacterium salarium TaxID=284579 RepID=UPI00278B9BDD|nr:amidase domain-containing protein [Salibacterium salarium]MDQ0299917.1 hypothetical protein [Salibacterium salarium]
MKKWNDALQEHLKDWMRFQLGLVGTRPDKTTPQETEMLRRLKRSLQHREATLLKIIVSFYPYRIHRFGKQENVTYQLVISRFMKIKQKYHIEEQVLHRLVKTHDGHLLIDKLIQKESLPTKKISTSNQQVDRGFSYDRRNAVQYAERWWDDYNSSYRKFTDNCTNFISQCLRAGGAPMRGMPERGKGWWYGKGTWSYSWAVAHSFRWYLSSSTEGLRASEVENVKELGLGDVICYDFNGDDRWQHSTIVTGFDGNEEPLVNAQTTNSRARYWTYEDSTAWTPNIKYKFFRIG